MRCNNVFCEVAIRERTTNIPVEKTINRFIYYWMIRRRDWYVNFWWVNVSFDYKSKIFIVKKDVCITHVFTRYFMKELFLQEQNEIVVLYWCANSRCDGKNVAIWKCLVADYCTGDIKVVSIKVDLDVATETSFDQRRFWSSVLKVTTVRLSATRYFVIFSPPLSKNRCWILT